MITIIGYLIMGVSAAVSVGAFVFNRAKTIAIALAYFVSYEILYHFLNASGHYQLIPYMSLAVCVDWVFFYLFLGRSARISALACAASLLYGGSTVIEHLVGGSLLYDWYEYVAIAVSLIILIDGSYRAYAAEHHLHFNRGRMHDRYHMGSGQEDKKCHQSKS